MVIMSVVWSIGAILEEPARPKFHDFMLDLIKGENVTEIYNIDLIRPYEQKAIPAKLLECQTIYDLCYDTHKLVWQNWMMTVPSYKVPVGGKFQELIIPTVDSIRNNYLLTLYINTKSHMLLTGPTGTGKTVNVINEIGIQNKKRQQLPERDLHQPDHGLQRADGLQPDPAPDRDQDGHQAAPAQVRSRGTVADFN